MDIDTLKQLDANIAEKVMGWTVFRKPNEFDNYDFSEDEIAYGFPEGVKAEGVPYEIPNFSSNIARAWEVRMKMEELGWVSEDRLSWMGWSNGKHPYGYSIWFKDWNKIKDIGNYICHHDHVSDHKQAPLAICRASLRAVSQ